MSETKPPRYRRQGCIKMTYQFLASILGVQVNSIQFIEQDNNAQILYMFHDDENLEVFDLAEGSVIPTTALKQDHFLKTCAEMLTRCGYEVVTPDAGDKEIKIECSDGSASIYDKEKDEVIWSMDLSYSDEVEDKLYQLLEMVTGRRRHAKITFPALEKMMEKIDG